MSMFISSITERPSAEITPIVSSTRNISDFAKNTCCIPLDMGVGSRGVAILAKYERDIE